MLSYRHAFHAGNHADVLKHLVLVQMLDYLTQKPAPLYVIDTHAGAGRYRLDAREAQKLEEYRAGIERIWGKNAQGAPEAVAAYLDAVREMNPSGELKQYPGSPWLAKRALRASDRLRLFELHGNESRLLAQNFKGAGREVQTTAGDGLALLKSLLPPPSRRALVLIDPSFETKNDYANVLAALKDALKRFASGTYALWYPQLAKIESRQLPDRLKRLHGTGADSDIDWLHVSLRVHAPATDGLGMSGSGMFIINPPWTLTAALRESLPWLTAKLAQDDTAEWKVETSADK